MTRIFVKPAEGRTVRSPDHNGQVLPSDGDYVKINPYWTRRLTDGDAIKASPAKPAKDALKEA
jgi:hypothetical protein